MRKLPALRRNQKVNLVITLVYSRAVFQFYKEQATVQHKSVVTGFTYIRDRVLEISCSSVLPTLVGDYSLSHLHSFRAPGLPHKGSLL